MFSKVVGSTASLRPHNLLLPNLILINVVSGKTIHNPQSVKIEQLGNIKKVDQPLKSSAIRQRSSRRVETRPQKKMSSAGYVDERSKNAPVNVGKTETSSLQSIENISGAKKTLDYDAIKNTVRAIAHESAEKQLPGADRPLSKAEKLEKAIGQAKRGDCRTEHAHLGILAIPFLLKDAVTDGGCKW
jgi:hypothetical protein